MRNNRSNAGLRRLILRWHRWLGIASAALVLVLIGTGIVLNHTVALRLDETRVSWPALLSWYGLSPPSDPLAFEAGPARVVWLDGTILLDGQPVAEDVPPVVGAVRRGENVLIATAAWLRLFTPLGTPVRRIGTAAFAGGIAALGRSPSGAFAVKDTSGAAFQSADLHDWTSLSGEASWSTPEPLGEDETRRLLETYRGPGLPLGRVVLDLHSGRILGSWGPILMDAAALFLLLVVATGFYNWLANRRGRSNGKRQ